jgi:hypothetical protein
MEKKLDNDKDMFEEYKKKDKETLEKNRIKAEYERNKGNECVKSKDYKEAM